MNEYLRKLQNELMYAHINHDRINEAIYTAKIKRILKGGYLL